MTLRDIERFYQLCRADYSPAVETAWRVAFALILCIIGFLFIRGMCLYA